MGRVGPREPRLPREDGLSTTRVATTQILTRWPGSSYALNQKHALAGGIEGHGRQGTERTMRSTGILIAALTGIATLSQTGCVSIQEREMSPIVVAENGTWPMPDEVREVAATFKKIAEANGVTRVDEWNDGFGLVDRLLNPRSKLP